jgi:hypothetical protein
MFSSPPDAIDFLTTLVDAVAAKWAIDEGTQIVPDGALGGASDELRHLFMEQEILQRGSTKLRRVELSGLDNLEVGSRKLLVSTLPLFGQPGGRNRPDEVVSRLLDVGRALPANGVAVLMAPSFYRTFRVGHFAELLSAEDIHVVGIVNTPTRMLLPHTQIQSMFVVISRNSPTETFAIDCQNLEDLQLNISNAFDHLHTSDLRTGIKIDLLEFQGFEHWYAQREIDALEGDYTKYEKFTLADVSLFINLARTGMEFEDIPNSVYLPMIGNGEAVDSLQKTTMKHQNYCQLVVDTSRATPQFLCNFLNTRHFRLYLEAEKVSKNQVIPKLNREQVRSLPVALPNLETQQKISHNIAKLTELRSMVDELVQNISVNPVSSGSMTKQVDEALAVFGRLSIEDQLYSLLVSGESKTVEFKQTFSLDISDNSKKSYLEDMVIKTIGAFLNSDGGDLLVGVNDDGLVTGIDFEIEKLHKNSRDEFLKHFKNRLKHRIGEQFYPKIRFDTVELNGKLVFHVNCLPSDIEVFVDEKDFFVRTNPATDKLEGPKLTAYVKQRFHQPSVAVLG